MKTKILIKFFLVVISLFCLSCLAMAGATGVMLMLNVGAVIITFSIFVSQIMNYHNELVQITNAINSEDTVEDVESDTFRKLENNIETLHRKLGLTADYISQLQRGNLEITDDVMKHDKIGVALLNVQDHLKALNLEEEQRKWVNEGLTLFAEILRNKCEMKEYGYRIIYNLVKYLKVNQGGIFIANEDEGGRYLELVACYAYERRKHLNDKVYEGYGLLGESMVERDFIFMTDVPKNYVRITSGLGGSVPRNLVIAPLMFNGDYFGAIEIAAFTVLQPFQIQFLKSVCESIGGEISTIRNIDRTQKLLNESNQLTQELKSSEEEMRTSVEELALTQEEMLRKQMELNSYLQAIDSTIASVQFDMGGFFVSANEIFLKVTGFTDDELAGKSYRDIMVEETSSEMMWQNIMAGQFFSGEFKVRGKNGAKLWLSGTFNPISTNKDGSGANKIMMYAYFTTQEKERVNDLSVMATALKSTLPVLELSSQFVCRAANDKFLKLVNISRVNLRSHTLTDLIAPYYAEVFDRVKDELLSKEFSTILLPISKGDKIITYETSISIAYNLEKEISRVILILIKEVEEQVSVLSAV